MGRLMTVAEVSELTTLAGSTLYDWRVKKVGPRSFKLNGRVVYDEDDVRGWIEAQRAATATDKATS
jgi:predicted DNA-binding transcriptional regulator AlpA